MRYLSVILLCGLLTGGASSGNQYQPSQPTYVQTGPTQWELLKRESDRVDVAYEQAFAANRAIDPIRGKIARSVTETTFEMLTNNAKPTESERAAILEFAKLREFHLKSLQALDTQYNNPAGRISEALRQATLALLADLYNGVLTYGEFAKKRQEANAIAQQAWERERNARLQAIAPFLLQPPLLFQPPPPMYVPPPIPLMVPPLSCTSNKIGSSVFTNCQ